MGGDFSPTETEEFMNKVALGTVQFGLDYGIANEAGQVSLSEAQCVLSLAKENEIDVLDTAIAYGTSEEVLGKVGVDGFRVVTKLPSLPDDQNNVAHWVTEQVSESLARLGQKKLYGLLLHRPENLLGSKGGQLVQALADLKNDGFVQKIGVSICSLDELEAVFNKIKIDLVQAPLNVVDRRLQSSGWLDRLKDDGVEVHTRSAFLQGLLLMERSKIPQKFSRWSDLWNQWHEKFQVLGISPLAASLAYPLSLKQVDQVIVGVDSAAQLSEILEAAENANVGLDTSFMSSADLDLINPSNWNHL
jgi:aryl-alcohol dehydrogenase-like predicted oxidoreductase